MTFYTRRMPVMTFYIPGVCQNDLSYTRSMPALVYAWHMQMPFQFFWLSLGDQTWHMWGIQLSTKFREFLCASLYLVYVWHTHPKICTIGPNDWVIGIF